MANAMFEVESSDLLRFAKQYSSLGDAIQSQLKCLMQDGLENDEGSSMTPGALQFCMDRIRGFNREIDEALEEMAEYHGMTDDFSVR